jgi:hypothetical protein
MVRRATTPRACAAPACSWTGAATSWPTRSVARWRRPARAWTSRRPRACATWWPRSASCRRASTSTACSGPGRAGLRRRGVSPACRCWPSAMAATSAPAPSSPRPPARSPTRSSRPSCRSTTAEQTPPREIVLDRDIPDRELMEQALSETSERKVPAQQRARRARRLPRPGPAQRGAGAGRGGVQPRQPAGARRTSGSCSGSTRCRAHRVLRHQPHHGRGDRGLLRGVRCRAGPVKSRSTGATTSPASSRATTTPPCTRPSTGASGAEAGGGGVLPDLLLIDGGAGQVAQARRCWASWAWRRACPRRGQGRGAQAGHETLLLDDGIELRPGAAGSRRCSWCSRCATRPTASPSPATAAAGRRRASSRLEDIPGIGPRRRASNLLRHFGGLAGLKAPESRRSRASRASTRRSPSASMRPCTDCPRPRRRARTHEADHSHLLTLLRIVLIPVLVLVFYLPFKWTNFAAAFVFLFAALTDWLTAGSPGATTRARPSARSWTRWPTS